MKRIVCVSVSIVVLLLCFLLCGCNRSGDASYPDPDTENYTDESTDESINQTIETALGDTGFSVKLPADANFQEQASEKHEFFGTGMNGSFAIMASRDEKGDYDMASYANEIARLNDAEDPKIAADGNYYLIRSDDKYTFYTALRQTEEQFCRITFYCFTEDWTEYESLFAEWATTIRYNK